MNGLPLDLIYKILFKMEPKSLMIMGCTNKSFKSLIFEDPYFIFNYSSPLGSIFIVNLLKDITCISMSPGKSKSTDILQGKNCHILDSRSGLLLLFIDGQLVVINPLTKKFRLIDHSESKCFPGEIPMGVGFLPEQNRRSNRFKIVCMFVSYDTYEFEISDGDSWRLSKTTITPSSKSSILLDKSVYFEGSFHWLRHDGSIIAFNPETEQAYLIPSSFQESLIPFSIFNHLFAVDDKINRLTYIIETRETISIYTLQNSKWSLAREIKIVYMEEETRSEYQDKFWKVVAYDGKQLLVEERRLRSDIGKKVLVYDMEANSWGFLGSWEWWVKCPICIISLQVYHKFTSSLFSVGNMRYFKEIVDSNEGNMSNLADVIGFINKNACVS